MNMVKEPFELVLVSPRPPWETSTPESCDTKPNVTREIWLPFGLDVCDLVLGIDVTDLNFWVQINLVKEPIQSNFVGSWNMPHCGTSTFHNHFDYRLIVLKDIQRRTGIRLLCFGWNVINVCWNDVGVVYRCGVMHVWLVDCWRLSPSFSLGSTFSFRYGMKHVNHEIPESESCNSIHA